MWLGAAMEDIGGVLRILCLNSLWQRFRKILAPVWTDCPLASKSGNRSHGQVGWRGGRFIRGTANWRLGAALVDEPETELLESVGFNVRELTGNTKLRP